MIKYVRSQRTVRKGDFLSKPCVQRVIHRRIGIDLTHVVQRPGAHKVPQEFDYIPSLTDQA